MSDLVAINVSREAYAQLERGARASGLSVDALVEELATKALGKVMLSLVGAQMEAMARDDPEAWEDYLREGAEIEPAMKWPVRD